MAGRILIADNVATNRIILKVKLAAARYDVVQANRVEGLLAAARQCLPDLIITDIDLPGGAIKAIRAGLQDEPELADIPIIAIAPLEERHIRLAGLRAGADEVLAKPLDEIALLALTRNLIRARVGFNELRAKQSVAREFGFAEAVRDFERPARLSLVPGSREAGFGWRAGLVGKINARIEVQSRTQALDDSSDREAPDVFVISADLTGERDGLRLISELRSREATRHALILLHDPAADATLMTMALDLGANAVLSGAFDAEALSLRIHRLLAQNLEADAMRQALEQQLSMAMVDPLTGLYNRRYAQSYLERIHKRARHKGLPFTLMLLDLDRFKQVNDRHGHIAGDEVLVEVARRLRANLREVDLLARFGGEEFLVVLPDTGRDEAAHAAERLRRVIGERPVRARSRKRDIPITLSIGVVVSDENGAENARISQLIDRADRALYASKSEGRNQITFVRAAA